MVTEFKSMKNNHIKSLASQVSTMLNEDLVRDKSLVSSFDPSGIKNPFAALPNVKDFKIITNSLDPLLDKYGIARKLEPEIVVDRLSNKIRGTNRYLSIIFKRLCRLLEQGRVRDFWILCLLLNKRSKSIRLSALRQLEHNWFKTFEVRSVKSMLTHLDRYLIKGVSVFRIARQYEPKVKADGSKTWRPIGAPSFSARMTLYIWYCYFSIFLGCYIRRYQHAYRRGRGLVTAWKHLAKSMSKYENIYEFDLKGFFPGINNSYIMWKLAELGLPKPIADYIFDLNLNYPDPKTLDESKLDESNAKFRAELDAFGLLNLDVKTDKQLGEAINSVMKDNEYVGEVLKPMFEFIKVNGSELLIELMSEDLGYSKEMIKANWIEVMMEYYQVQAALFESFASEKKPADIPSEDIRPASGEAPFNVNNLDSSKGLPQGGSLSPILSIFAFEYSLMRNHFEKIFQGWGTDFDIVAYADDFILLWNNPEVTVEKLFSQNESLESMGIEFSKEKSGPIKLNGEYTVDKFKFLGKTYFPKEDIIMGTPRSGNKNSIPQSVQEAIVLFNKRQELLRELSTQFSLGMTPQEILNSHGRSIFPFSCLPDSLIEDAEPLTDVQKRFFATALQSEAMNFSQFEELYPNLVSEIRGDITQREEIRLPGGGVTFEEFLKDYQWERFKQSQEAKKSSPADLDKYTEGPGSAFSYLENANLSGFVTSKILDQGFCKGSELAKEISQRSPRDKSWLSYQQQRAHKYYTKLNLFNTSSYATLSLMENKLFSRKNIKNRK